MSEVSYFLDCNLKKELVYIAIFGAILRENPYNLIALQKGRKILALLYFLGGDSKEGAEWEMRGESMSLP